MTNDNVNHLISEVKQIKEKQMQMNEALIKLNGKESFLDEKIFQVIETIKALSQNVEKLGDSVHGRGINQRVDSNKSRIGKLEEASEERRKMWHMALISLFLSTIIGTILFKVIQTFLM